VCTQLLILMVTVCTQLLILMVTVCTQLLILMVTVCTQLLKLTTMQTCFHQFAYQKVFSYNLFLAVLFGYDSFILTKILLVEFHSVEQTRVQNRFPKLAQCQTPSQEVRTTKRLTPGRLYSVCLYTACMPYSGLYSLHVL